MSLKDKHIHWIKSVSLSLKLQPCKNVNRHRMWCKTDIIKYSSVVYSKEGLKNVINTWSWGLYRGRAGLTLSWRTGRPRLSSRVWTPTRDATSSSDWCHLESKTLVHVMDIYLWDTVCVKDWNATFKMFTYCLYSAYMICCHSELSVVVIILKYDPGLEANTSGTVGILPVLTHCVWNPATGHHVHWDTGRGATVTSGGKTRQRRRTNRCWYYSYYIHSFPAQNENRTEVHIKVIISGHFKVLIISLSVTIRTKINPAGISNHQRCLISLSGATGTKDQWKELRKCSWVCEATLIFSAYDSFPNPS